MLRLIVPVLTVVLNIAVVSGPFLFAQDKAILPKESKKVFESGEKRAIVIGINNYKNANNLDFCVADAESLKKVLEETGCYENVKLLTDKTENKPTKANLDKAIKKFLTDAKEKDTVIVFFSGHGGVKKGQGFLVPSDYDPKNWEKTVLKTDDLRDYLNGCKAEQKFFFLDCCHAGAQGAKGGLQPWLDVTPEELALGSKFKASGFFTLTSCAKNEVSWEVKKFGNGLFTHFLVKGFEGSADNDDNGLINIDELYGYTSSSVAAYSTLKKNQIKLQIKLQTPRRIIGSEAFGVPVLARCKPSLPPPPVNKEIAGLFLQSADDAKVGNFGPAEAGIDKAIKQLEQVKQHVPWHFLCLRGEISARLGYIAGDKNNPTGALRLHRAAAVDLDAARLSVSGIALPHILCAKAWNNANNLNAAHRLMVQQAAAPGLTKLDQARVQYVLGWAHQFIAGPGCNADANMKESWIFFESTQAWDWLARKNIPGVILIPKDQCQDLFIGPRSNVFDQIRGYGKNFPPPVLLPVGNQPANPPDC